MKTRLTFTAFALMVAALVAAPAQAQETHAQHTATVPFAFNAGGVDFPAGTYAITQFGNHMQLRKVDGGKAAILTALPCESAKTPNESALRFEMKGETLVLSNVFYAGSKDGIELLNKKTRAASRAQ